MTNTDGIGQILEHLDTIRDDVTASRVQALERMAAGGVTRGFCRGIGAEFEAGDKLLVAYREIALQLLAKLEATA